MDALISQIYFWNKTLHVSDSSSVPHQEFFTVHTAMVYRLHLQLASRIRTVLQFRRDPARKLSANIYEFYSKNKLEKLVHLVGFNIRIYHDARSPERPI